MPNPNGSETYLIPGVDRGNGRYVRNRSVAQQALTAATLTYLTGSKLRVPVDGFKAGDQLRWKFNVAKTAAGTATSTFAIVVGTAGTTADTARVSFTKPAGTAAADEGVIEIVATVRTVSATGVIAGEFTLIHNLAATGHAQVPVVALSTISSGFDNTAAELIVGLVATTGAADAVTIEVMSAEYQGT